MFTSERAAALLTEFTPGRVAALLLLLTAAMYAPTLGYGFVYEDLNDPEAFFREGYTLAAWQAEALAKPLRSLTVLSQLLHQWAFGWREVWAFHAANVGWHLLNGWLLYRVGRLVLPAWGAVAALAVFLLHPVQVESVAYVSARPDLVSVAAVLLALWSVLRDRVWLAWLCCGLAMLGKETAITAYLLIPFAAWVLGCRWSWPVRVVWGLFLAVPAVYLAVRYPMAGDMAYALEQLAALSRLLLLIVCPVGLTIDHDWTVITPAVHVLTLIAWSVVAMVAWERQWRVVLVGMGWVLLAVAPRFVVPLVEGLHEHHLLLPMVGISLCLGWLVSDRKAVWAT